MKPQRVLITGASGFVGGHLCKYFAGTGASVTACYRSQQVSADIQQVVTDLRCVDLSIGCEVEELVSSIEPNVVIHCAALSKMELCEHDPELAKRSNVDALHHLIRAVKARQSGACSLIYLSTDLVFDALSAPQGGFLECDIPKAISVYGQSKLEAERLVLDSALRAAVCRLSLVYGSPIGGKGGFMDWILRGFKAQLPLNLFIDEWRTPVFIGDVCRALDVVAQTQLEQPCTFHLAGSERIDRHSFGLKVAQVLGYSTEGINSVTLAENTTSTPRAADASLSNRWTCAKLGISFLDVTSGLEEMKAALGA